jgi:hypothetical protein
VLNQSPMLQNREYPDEQHWRLARVVGAIRAPSSQLPGFDSPEPNRQL